VPPIDFGSKPVSIVTIGPSSRSSRATTMATASRAITALVSGGQRITASMMSRVDVGGCCGAGDEVDR
jgi:hypothetical protein